LDPLLHSLVRLPDPFVCASLFPSIQDTGQDSTAWWQVGICGSWSSCPNDRSNGSGQEFVGISRAKDVAYLAFADDEEITVDIMVQRENQ
jgi:hypothetical protein